MLINASSSFLIINTKLEAYRLIHEPSRLFSLLYSKYGDIKEDLYLLYINQLVANLPTKYNTIFKEMKYSSFLFEYLRRIYRKKESIDRIPKLTEYYKNYHLFFCRPIFRNRILSQLLYEYEDNKAELFYKNNYQHNNSHNLFDKSLSKEKYKNKSNNKKNSSFSFSSLDNLTNNKIIFDKKTKKMLERVETDVNNYYNTLTLETSKSNLISNNNNCLLNKGTIDSSFEQCIYALVNYQNNKNKIKNNKNEKNIKKKIFKRKKNIIISELNSNFEKNFKYYKQNNIMNVSQRNSHNNSNFNIKQKIYTFLDIKKEIKSVGIKNITRANSNYAHNKHFNSAKKKKNSLFSLSINRYINNRINILSNSINNIIRNKKAKKLTINNKNETKIEEFNINRHLIKNKYSLNYVMTGSSKKNKTHIIKNNSKVFSNLNIYTNNDNNKNLILENENKYKKLSKLTEYLNQTKSKDKKNIKNDFDQKKLYHKKDSISIICGEKKDKCINKNISNIKRITKKKIIINKNQNLKIAIDNINNINQNNNINNINTQKGRHIKNKTFDYNTINQITEHSKQNPNITNINIEEFNTIFNKPKKIIYKINTDNNNLKKNKLLFSKGENKVKNKTSKSKNPIFSPSTKKINNQIPFAHSSSKGKNVHKNLIVKIFNPNSKNTDCEFIKDNNSNNTIFHLKNNYSMLTKEDLFHKNFSGNKYSLVKTEKSSKNNIKHIKNSINNNNIFKKNISVHLSPIHHINKKIKNSSKNKKTNKNSKQKNSKYSINKNTKIINNKKANNILKNNNSMRKNKNLQLNIYLTANNTNNNIGNNIGNLKNITENKIISRNKKHLIKQNTSKKSKVNINNSKKGKIIKKSNSIINKNILSNTNSISTTNYDILNNLNNNISLNTDISSQNSLNKNILHTQGNINISLGDNNINIKDSILHINKIYIKNNNFTNNISNKNITYKIQNGKNCCLNYKKAMEINMDYSQIKTEGKIIKKNFKSLNSKKDKKNNSLKSNENRNSNIPNQTKNLNIKYKKPNIQNNNN